MAQQGGLPLVNTDVPELQGPRVFEQPKAPQFTYTEQVPITPQYRFDIDPGINWAELGSQAFAVAADIYGKSLNYMANTKANKLQDLTNQTQKKINGMAEAYETGQLNVPAGMDPVQYAAEQTERLKEEYRFKARDIIGDFSYETEDAGPTLDGKPLKRTVDIFDANYNISGLGLVWQDIIVGARGTDIGLDEMMDRQLISIGKAYGKQQETNLSVQRYLENNIPYSSLSKDAQAIVDSPFFNGTRPFPIDDPNFGMDQGKPRTDAAGNPVFLITEAQNPNGSTQLFAMVNPNASLSGASVDEIKFLVGLDAQFQNNLGLTDTTSDLLKTFLASPQTMDSNTSFYALSMYGALPETTKASYAKQQGFSEEQAFTLNAASSALKVGADIPRVKAMMKEFNNPETMQRVMQLEKGILSGAVVGESMSYTGFMPQSINPAYQAEFKQTQELLSVFSGIVEGAVRSANISVPPGAFVISDGAEAITEADRFTLAQVIRSNPTFAQALREATVALTAAQQSGLITTDEEKKAFTEQIVTNLSGKFAAIEDEKGNITLTHGPVFGMLQSKLNAATSADTEQKTTKTKLEQAYKGSLTTNTEFIPAPVAIQVFGSDLDLDRATALIRAGGRVTTSKDSMLGQAITMVPQAEQMRIYAASKKSVIEYYGGKPYVEMSEDERDAAFEKAYLDIPQAHLWDFKLLTGERNSLNVDTLPFGIASIPTNYPDKTGNSNLLKNGSVFIQETLMDGMLQPQDRSGNPAITYGLRGTSAQDEKQIKKLIEGYGAFKSEAFDITARTQTPVSAKPMSVTRALVNLIEKYEQNPAELDKSLAIADILDTRGTVPPLTKKTPSGFVAWVMKNESKLVALSESPEWPFTKEQTRNFIAYVDNVVGTTEDLDTDPAIQALVYGLVDSLPRDRFRQDGSLKSAGWLGPFTITDKQGRSSQVTEYSITVGVDGEDITIPTLVPGLTQQQIDSVLTAAQARTMPPQDVVDAAIAHAMKRKQEGKSVWSAANTDGLSGIGMVIGGIQMVNEMRENNQPDQVNTNFDTFAYDTKLVDGKPVDIGISRPEFDSDLFRINDKNSGVYGLLYYQVGHPKFEEELYKAGNYNLFVNIQDGSVVALEKGELPPSDSRLVPTTQSALINLNKKAIKFSWLFAQDKANIEFEKLAKASRGYKQGTLDSIRDFVDSVRDVTEGPLDSIKDFADSVRDVTEGPLDSIRDFVQPFRVAGNMDVWPASERSSPEAWAKHQASQPWWNKSYDILDIFRSWWQSSGTETKKEFKSVYPELANILDKARSEQELLEYAPQFEQLLKAATEPIMTMRQALLGNYPDATTMYRNEQDKAFKQGLNKERELRKAVQTKQKTLEEIRTEQKAWEENRNTQKLSENLPKDVTKITTVLSDFGKKIVEDARKALKDNAKKVSTPSKVKIDGFTFNLIDRSSLREEYEKVYGKELTEKLFKDAEENRSNAPVDTSLVELPNYNTNTEIPVYATSEELNIKGMLRFSRQSGEPINILLDSVGRNNPGTKIHEFTHLNQPKNARNYTPKYWQEAINLFKEDASTAKHAAYVLSFYELPAHLAEFKTLYFLQTGKTLGKNPSEADIEKAFEVIDLRKTKNNIGIIRDIYKALPKYRRTIKTILDSVAVSITETNERIA